MRNLKIIEHVSLDGVIQHSADENGFAHTDWTAPYRTAEGGAKVMAAHGDEFDLLLGRRTYDMWATMWGQAPSNPVSDRINAATKYVATHRPDSLDWGPAEGVGPDFAEGVRRIKTQDGPGLVVSGSSTVTTKLLEHELADQVVLIVYPVLLGAGKRLFAEDAPLRSFELSDSTVFPSGVVMNTYFQRK
jgi:dihydrofolate reductase